MKSLAWLFLSASLLLIFRSRLKSIFHRALATKKAFIQQHVQRLKREFIFLNNRFSGISPLLYIVIRKRRIKRFNQQFSHALPQIASTLRCGHSFERALKALADSGQNPLKQEFELVLKEIQLGTSMEEALESLASRFPNQDLEILIRAVSISRKVGSNLAEIFTRVAEMIQARNQLHHRLSALTAQGKAQTYVTVLLPILILMALSFIDPGYLTPLFNTSQGRAILILCSIQLMIGSFWVYKICKMELFR